MKKQFYKIEDVKDNIQSTYEKGKSRGYFLQWKDTEDALSFVKGYPVVWFGPPHSGKTQIVFEVAIQLSFKYGLKWAVASPETGFPFEVFEELVEMVAGQNLSGDERMPPKEKTIAEAWVSQYFYVIDIEVDEDNNMDFNEFHDAIQLIEDTEGFKFDGTIMDTFDDIEIDWSGGQRDLVLQSTLKKIRKKSKAKSYIDFIVCHLSNQEQVTRKMKINENESKDYTYWPLPVPQKIIHGQEWFRRMYTMIGVWRPPKFLKHSDNTQYTPTSTVLSLAKRKPKTTFRKGDSTKLLHLYYAPSKNRYYIKDENGDDIYGETTKSEETTRRSSSSLSLGEH